MRAYLLNVPQTAQDWATWGYAHRDDHQIIRDSIQNQFNVNLQNYDIDPVPFEDTVAMFNWLERNQLYHNDFNGTVGLQGSSLLDVDLNDPRQAEAWIYIHWQEHNAAGFKLGV